MAITTRQTSLLVAEDWTKIYQTFRNADFQSYDYETLRKSMIDYLRTYYPEDFNDFTESSEYIALIDLIAFLGQSLAFRGDLNARENYIDTAQRRDSVFKLARLISYTPKRNIPASGILKVDSVSTTETIYDSDGIDLSGLVIDWADAGNDNWQEQFNAVLTAALTNNQVVGKPSSSQVLNGVTTSEYQVNLIPNVVATYRFQATVEGAATPFEVVSASTKGQNYIYEVDPKPSQYFNLLYQNDNLGNSSNNTGFFLYFKQGALQSSDFAFNESIPNRVYNVNVNNINNTDLWLYSVNSNGSLGTLWTQVPAVGVTNIIYNKQTNKNIYQVNTRAGDQIDLVFGDGSFANIPQGNYRLFYRTSNGLNYKITPTEMQRIVVPVNYTSRSGRVETLSLTVSLQYTVANATSRETVEEIRQKAPQQYYTQNRMVTGEDYNILPYTLYSSVQKVKAVNRTSSGVSRYLDVVDVTGKYSSTNIFCQDGMLYRDEFTRTFAFDFTTKNDIYRIIYNKISTIATSKELQHFFYAFYDKKSFPGLYWNQSSTVANGSTGYFYDSADKIVQIGDYVSNNNKYIKPGAIVKFSAGTGMWFNARNEIIVEPTVKRTGDKQYLYAAVEQVLGDGTNGGLGNLSNGDGVVTINQEIPDGAIALEAFAVFNNNFTTSLIESIVGYVQAYEDFGLRYDVDTSAWAMIKPQDLDTGDFSDAFAGNTSGSALDASWLIYFKTVGQTYTVSYRGLEYIFESVLETNFYFDDSVKIYDPKTGSTLYDQINVLKINAEPDNSRVGLGVDYNWQIYNNITEVDGYVNPSKILVTFSDSDNDGIPDNPELFDIIVNPTLNSELKYVYFLQTSEYDNFITYQPVSNDLVDSSFTTLLDIETNKARYSNGDLFYLPGTNKFYQLTVPGYTVAEISGYVAKIGRQDIYFQYRHNSPNYRRIDPSPNNIIDLYILTKQYATDYTAWIQDRSNKLTKPSEPSSNDLSIAFSGLEKYKSISDTLIYNPAKFKPIFGEKANIALQATFKVVKNSSVIVSDNDIKTSVIAAINTYFDVANWDFGETFYFSELSAYLHSTLSPNVASITIVPASESSVFGSLLQINAEYNEIITSAATVDNVQIISAITAAQINQTVIA
jgi:hypothetical protein